MVTSFGHLSLGHKQGTQMKTFNRILKLVIRGKKGLRFRLGGNHVGIVAKFLVVNIVNCLRIG